MPGPPFPRPQPHTSSATGRPSQRLRSRLRRAWRRLHWSWIALEASLLLLVGCLLAAWINIPDTNRLEIALTLLLAVGGVGATVWAQSSLFRLVRTRRHGRIRLATALLVLGTFCLFWGWSALLSSGTGAVAVWVASRPTLGLLGPVLLALANLASWLLQTIVGLLLLSVALESTAAPWTRPRRQQIVRVWQARDLWPMLLAASAAITLVVDSTLAWRPFPSESAAAFVGYLKVVWLWLFLSVALTYLCSLLSTFLRDAEDSSSRALGPKPSA